MRLLLDTHVFIWWRVRDRELPSEVRAAIRDADDVFVSMASAWEIAIKTSIGKLRLAESIEAGLEASYFASLPIAFKHIDAVSVLPLYHRDPFDRMLVAQCLTEGLILVTGDRQFEPYNIPFLWL